MELLFYFTLKHPSCRENFYAASLQSEKIQTILHKTCYVTY